MNNQNMEKIASLSLLSNKLALVRWLVRAILLMFLVTTLLNQAYSQFWLGLFFVILPLGVGLDLFKLFVRGEVGRLESKLKPGELTFSTATLLHMARGRSDRLWYFLTKDKSTMFVLLRLGIRPKDFYQKITKLPDIASWVEHAQLVAKTSHVPCETQHLFEVIQADPGLQAVWDSIGITAVERNQVWAWWCRLEQVIKKEERGFNITLSSTGGIGRDWASGYTNVLQQYASNITQDIRRVAAQITLIGHREEREKIMDYLSRDDRHNIVIIGEEGIGKQRLIYSLAADLVRGKVPDALRYKHILQLDTGAVVNGGASEEIEARLSHVLNEAENAGNIILVIPDFQLLIGAATSKTLGIINAAGLLTGYLQRPGIQIVAITSPSDYYTYIKPNPTLEPFLQSVEVHEIGSGDALTVLEDETTRFEAKSKRIMTHQALNKIIEIAERHVHDQPYPEKALALLGEVTSSSVLKNPVVTARDVEAVLSEKLKVPLGQVNNSERLALTNLEETIKSRIVGQTEAVKSVANALRRARSGLSSGKRPVGTFLFLGPTGVGKTEMAKTIAELYYKNPKAMIRLDMSEYQTPDSLDKLVGTKTQPGLLTTAVTDQPFSVVLLDEIEKADASVRNLFLQILDAGRVTDGYGKTVDFTNSMVIATSNAGAQMIRDAVQANQVDGNFKSKLLDYIQDQGIFAPEWLNRFDATVVFLPLTQAEILQVAHLQVADLVKQMATHDIELTVAEDVYPLLAEKGFDPEYGARPMRRAIQDLVENALAKELLNNPNQGKKQITLTRSMLEK